MNRLRLVSVLASVGVLPIFASAHSVRGRAEPVRIALPPTLRIDSPGIGSPTMGRLGIDMRMPTTIPFRRGMSQSPFEPMPPVSEINMSGTVPQPLLAPLAALQVIADSSHHEAPILQSRLGALWEGSPAVTRNETDLALDRILTVRASPGFADEVRSTMARLIPSAVLRRLAHAGYGVHVNDTVRQGRDRLPDYYDQSGGCHFPGEKTFVIAEHVWNKSEVRWQHTRNVGNAVAHETGHAIGFILGELAARYARGDQAQWYHSRGFSEHPEFRAAWRNDFQAISSDFLDSLPRGDIGNGFGYFIHADPATGFYQAARQETLAEIHAILWMWDHGPTLNSDNFRRWFSPTIAVTIRLIEAQLGPVFPQNSPFRERPTRGI